MTGGEASYGALLDAVRGVRWPATRRSVGASLGAHRSRLRGNSSEFSEFRPYRQGDDSRRLDWRLLARSDRAYVRLTTDRATLRTAILVDASASLAFPLPAMDKWQRACEVAVALAAIAYAEGDPVGLTIDSEPPQRLAPRARRSAIAEMIHALAVTTPGGSGALAPLLTATRASRVAVVTDLLGDAEALLAAARLKIVAGGEVLVVHLVAPEELDPPAGAQLAVDPEQPALRRSLGGARRVEYRRTFEAWLGEMRTTFRAGGVRYVRAQSTDAATRIVRRIADASGARDDG